MKLFQYVSEWILRLVWTNLLWIAFTLSGLVIAGFFPATIAMFTVTRKWAKKEMDFSIWQLFKDTYKKEWVNSNKIGLIFICIAAFLFIDLRITFFMKGFFSIFLYVFILFLFAILLLTLIYFFPLYVQYTYSAQAYIKQAFIHAIAGFKDTFVILVGLVCIGYFIYKLPGLIPFMSAVLPSYWVMTVCMKRFRRLEKMVSEKMVSGTARGQ